MSRQKRRQKPQRRAQGRSPESRGSNARGVVANGYSTNWLRKGFPWVYEREVVQSPRAVKVGDHPLVLDGKGAVLGRGVWDEGAIALRRFRTDDGPLDEALFLTLLQAALRRRRVPPGTTAWRLVHGESDDLPGIRIEIFDATAVITLDSKSLLSVLDALQAALQQLLPLNSIWLHWRHEDGDSHGADDTLEPLIWGEGTGDDLVVEELGLKYRVRPSTGHDIGLFVDMRDIRAWMAPHWSQRRVLNLFCYTGAFSVSAAAHGAAHVTSVDLSAPIIERAKANFVANELPVDAHSFLVEDSFKALDRFRRKGELFDVIVADPPSFSHGPAGTWSVSKDYKRLVVACLRVLRPGGWLIAATNLGSISPKEFKGYLIDGAERAGRRLRLIHEGSPPVDVPAALHFPQARYLKCWIVEG